jgi:uncharacterized protein (TIGR03086 family)
LVKRFVDLADSVGVAPGYYYAFMPEDADRYARVSGGFTERLQGVRPDQWTLPTPCEEWTVRDLVVHVVNTQRRVLGLLGGPVTPAEPDGDLMAQWSEARAALLDAVRDPVCAAIEVEAFAGPTRFGKLVGDLACSDTVVHTWDLARATGQPETLDPGAVEHCAGVIAGFGEAMRRPGGFGPPLDCPADADPQSKFLHFAGRAV